MPEPVSEDMVREAFAAPAQQPIILVTITAEGLDAPIRVCNEPGRLEGEEYLGVMSRGQPYPHYPFALTWTGAGDGEPTRNAKLSIANVDGTISQTVRLATGQPSVTIEMVRRDDPDTVEQTLSGATLINAEIDETQADGELRARSFADEPACFARYTLSRTPALG